MQKLILVIAMTLVLLVLGSSCVPIDTGTSPAPARQSTPESVPSSPAPTLQPVPVPPTTVKPSPTPQPPSQYTLTIFLNQQGNINVTPSGENSAGRPILSLSPQTGLVNASLHYYNAGAQVTAEAKAKPGYKFSHWEGDIGGTQNPVKFALSRDTKVIAVFIDDKSEGTLQVANLSKAELVFLGKGIREVISSEKLKQTDLNHRRQLSVADELAKRIENASDNDIRYFIREKTESQELILKGAGDLAGILSEWATGAVAASLLLPPVLIASLITLPAATIIEKLTPILTERLTMGSVGSVGLHSLSDGQKGLINVVYDRKKNQAIVSVDTLDNPRAPILISIQFKKVIWDENAGSTIAVMPEYGGDEIEWPAWVHYKPAPVVAWEVLAEQWANYYGLDARLLKATVEAESGGKNIPSTVDLDENGNPTSFGYGQVQPKGHYDKIHTALKDAVGLETKTTDVQELGKLILQYNEVSMATAALVVKTFWNSSGDSKDFSKTHFIAFFQIYVGSKVTQQELDRRWKIWGKWFSDQAAVTLNKSTPLSPGEALGSSHTAISATPSVTFSWNKNNSGATYAVYIRDITGYDDNVGIDVGTLVTNGLNVGDTNSYVWSGAAAGKKYRWQVEAVKSGVTELSDRLVFTTQAAPVVTAPNPPVLTLAGAGNGYVDLSWTTPSNGGSPITGYKIYRDTASGDESYFNSTTPDWTTFHNTTVVNGTTYYYKVTAVNAVGESALSNEVSGTPTAPAKFNIGNSIKATANLNVRNNPGTTGTTIIKTIPSGSVGTILSGPVQADGYTWWQVTWSDGTTGWSVENWLEKT